MTFTIEMLGEFGKWLSENKEDETVKKFIDGYAIEKPIDAAQVLAYMETDAGKAIVQPIVDKRVTTAVQTRDKFWETEKLEPELKKRLAVEVLKMNPKEEPWQKEIRELKEENEKEKSARAQDNLKRLIVEKAAALGVEPFFIDEYTPPSIEQGELFLQKIREHNTKLTEKITNDLIAKNAYVPGAGKEKEGKIDFSKLTMAEAVKMEMEGKLDSN